MGKKALVYGVTCIKLNERDVVKIISQKKGVFVGELSRQYPNSQTYAYKIYGLADSSYLYQYTMGGYLFSHLSELNSFLNEERRKILEFDMKYQRFDTSFVSKIDKLIRVFEERYSIQFNFSALSSLKKLDSAINNNVVDLNENYCTIVAIVGKYFTENVEGAVWMNQQWGKGIIPIIQNKTTLYSPVDIVEENLNRKNNNKPCSLYTSAKRSFDKGNY